MTDTSSQRITITLPAALLQQIDRLAEHEYGNRSTIIREALLKFVRQPANKLVADPDSVAIAKQYKALKPDYPYLDPTDSELIQFFYQQKMQQGGAAD